MSGAQILGDEALRASCEDRDEGNCNERDEVVLRALEDGVQPSVAAQPGEGALNHPADSSRNELAIATAGNRLDGDAECLAGFCQPLAPVAEIPERWALEAPIGEFEQNWNNGFRVMPVCWRDIDRQRDAVFVDGDMDLDASDLLSAVDTSKQLDAERQDRLSITTALGSGASPQAHRQVRRSRSSIRRQRPSRVQRANSP
jgi:hypothetical protein